MLREHLFSSRFPNLYKGSVISAKDQTFSDDKITISQLESHLWESANILRGPVDAADSVGSTK